MEVEFWVCNQVSILWFSFEVSFRCPLKCPSYGCEQTYDDRKLRDLPKNVWPFGAHDLDDDHDDHDDHDDEGKY